MISSASNLYSIRARLESVLNRRQVPGLSLRVGLVPPDQLELRIEVGDQKWIMPVVWSNQPFQAEKLRQAGPEISEYFIACPNISGRIANQYMEEPAICHADLNGRFFLSRGAVWIFREPEEDTVRNPEQKASPYSVKASRIPRILLNGADKAWTQAALHAETKTSPGYVSRVLKQLIQANQVSKTGRGGPGGVMQYRVVDREGILSDWEKEDRFLNRVEIHAYSVLESDLARLASNVRDALEGDTFAFTQWTGAWLRHPHTTPPVVSLYVKPQVLDRFQLGRPVEQGGNLWLLIPKDEGVFQAMQTVNGFPLVSDAQIYLDLIGMGRRGPDAARALREWEGFGGDSGGT